MKITKVRVSLSLAVLVFTTVIVACDDSGTAPDVLLENGLIDPDKLNDEARASLEGTEQFDMNLVVPDGDDGWQAPLDEAPTSLSDTVDPAAGYSMHNQLISVNGTVALWAVYANGGGVCAPTYLFAQHCANIATFVKAKGWATYIDFTTQGCPGLIERWCYTY